MSGTIKLLFSSSLFFVLVACQTLNEPTTTLCNPLGYDKEALLSLKTSNYEIANAEQRQLVALQLLSCLGHPDPELRDGVAYEAYVTLLRAKQLNASTIKQLRTALVATLAGPDDELGLHKPFAALTLAEVARADRLDPVFTMQQRAELISSATGYLTGITDYRGYDDIDGWRHGVAHTADLLLQLALNPAVTSGQLTDIATAIATQIAPPGEHFYIYGESVRLARPIYFIAMRGELSEQQWADWFAGLASPAPFADWNDVWTSQAGLAKLHNTRAFAATIYTYVTADEAPELKPLVDGALVLLKSLP